MKRVLSLFLCLLMLASLLAGCAADAPTQIDVPVDTEFDESNVVLQFGAVSDIHIGRTGTGLNTVLWAKDAYKMLRDMALEYNDKGLDAMFVSGDLTNNGTVAQAEEFAEIYETVFDPTQVPLIFSLGNHDVNSGSSFNKATLGFEDYYAAMGEEYRQYEKDSDLPNGCVHQIVGDYHFIAINPMDKGYRNTLANNVTYHTETKEWLDKTLAKITKDNPDQYVFVSTHPLIYGTAYGSEHTYTTTGWFTRELTDILEKYPQVMTFGGHVHFPINSDLSIMQTDFTALQCGSVNYMSVEDGEYRDMNTSVSLIDRDTIHNGYLVQVDGSGNVRIVRLNFGLKREIKYPFVLQAPQADGSHLLDYGWDRGSAENNAAPVLAEDAITVVDNAAEVGNGLTVDAKVVFKAATDDDQVHAYALTVRNEAGTIMETERILADFYKVLQPEQMKTEWTVHLKDETYRRGMSYEIMLIAIDDWGFASNVVTYTYAP